MNPKSDAADRSHGGPGSSHQDATKPEPPDKEPEPGEPTNPRRSRVSGGGGERDSHHTRNPKDK
ncbi:MAG TPA: hypothetical protein VFA12_15115 [Stellaceae bacterium]|nr:hypothetical protein [Stellaceae bacterium]